MIIFLRLVERVFQEDVVELPLCRDFKIFEQSYKWPYREKVLFFFHFSRPISTLIFGTA